MGTGTAILITLVTVLVCKVTSESLYPPKLEETTRSFKDKTYCYPIGQYNDKSRNSLRYWCLGVEALLYRKKLNFDIHEYFISWNKEFNLDPEQISLNAIEDAHTLFLQALDDARENKTEPKFKVSPEFDFHDYGHSLSNNDYVDMSEAVNYIESIISTTEV